MVGPIMFQRGWNVGKPFSGNFITPPSFCLSNLTADETQFYQMPLFVLISDVQNGHPRINHPSKIWCYLKKWQKWVNLWWQESFCEVFFTLPICATFSHGSSTPLFFHESTPTFSHKPTNAIDWKQITQLIKLKIVALQLNILHRFYYPRMSECTHIPYTKWNCIFRWEVPTNVLITTFLCRNLKLPFCAESSPALRWEQGSGFPSGSSPPPSPFCCHFHLLWPFHPLSLFLVFPLFLFLVFPLSPSSSSLQPPLSDRGKPRAAWIWVIFKFGSFLNWGHF